ncbi:MAG: hypothetical protein WC457_01955 [Patescibacteria group bacterium]
MNSKQLNRLLNLVRETGDRLVVADNESDDVFVLMNLDEYENLSGNGEFDSHEFCHECEHESKRDEFNDDFDPEELNENAFDFSASEEPEQKKPTEMSERELLEKINGDIADWRSAQTKKEENELAEELVEEKISEPESRPVDDNSGEEKIQVPSGIASIGDVLFDKKYQNREFDNTPRTGIIEEDDLSGVPHEEEKFYLEPVE